MIQREQEMLAKIDQMKLGHTEDKVQEEMERIVQRQDLNINSMEESVEDANNVDNAVQNTNEKTASGSTAGPPT